ncbi:MAG: TolC family protein [Bacteroidales bacterium]|jgi:outer membrane protein|nr:TolC family protein [Bacteroidales bacterium]
MKKIIILTLLTFPIAGFTQKAWTLKECIDYALENNIQIKQATMLTESNQMQWNQAKYNRLPSVNAGLSDGFSFGRTLSRDNTYTNQNSNSADASLSANVPIFQGMRMANDIAAQKLNFLASLEDHQRIKNDISLNVASLFLNVLVQKEFFYIAQNQRDLTDTLLRRSEILVNTGREPVSRLYELKAQLANDNYNVTNTEKNLHLALLDLAQLLELENTLLFDVATPFFSTDISQMPIPAVSFEDAMVTLPNVKAEEFRLERSKKNLDIAKGAYLPSLSVGASTSTGYFYMSGNSVIPNDPFGSQLSNNWRSYVGMSMNIPIFNRMSVRTNVSQSKLQIQNQELEVENAKKAIYKDIQRAMLNAKVSKDRYIAAVNSVHANQESYRFVEQRYESGRSTFFDMQQSRYNLERALSEQIQAKYEFIFNTKVLDFYNGKSIDLQ